MKLAVLTTGGMGLITACVVTSIWVPTSFELVGALVESREEQMLSTSKDVALQIQEYFQKASAMTQVLEYYWNNALAAAPEAPMQYMIRTYGLAMYHYLLDHPELNSCFVVVERDPRYVNSLCDIDGWLFSTSYLSEMLNTTTGAHFDECPMGSSQSCANKVRLASIAGAKNVTHPTTVVGTIFDVGCDKWLLGSTTSMMNGNLTRWSTPSSHGITQPIWSWAYPDVAGTYPRQSILHAVWRPIQPPAWPTSNSRIAFTQCSIRLSKISINKERSESMSTVLERTARQVGLSTTLLVISFKREVVATSIPDFAPERVLSSGEITGLKLFDNETLPGEVRSVGELIESTSCTTTPCDFSRLPPITRHAGNMVAFVPVHDPLSEELGLLVVMMVPTSEIEAPARSLERKLAIISTSIFVVACLVALVFGVVVAKPITTFEENLMRAASLRGLEGILATKQKSMVSEIRVMNTSLKTLVKALMEYRGYLPTTVLDEASSEESCVESTSLTKESKSGGGTFMSSSTGLNRSGGWMGRAVVKVHMGLSVRNVAVACLNVREWQTLVRGKDINSDEVVKQITAMLSILKGSLEKGSIDRFNGDRFMVTWNGGLMCRDGVELSAQGCLQLSEAVHSGKLSLFPPGSVGIAVCNGSALCGSVGIDSVRAHNVVGPAVTAAHVLCDLASLCAIERPVVLADGSAVKFSRTVAVPVGACRHLRGLRPEGLVFEVLGARGTGPEQEWMYCFEEASDGSQWTRYMLDYLKGGTDFVPDAVAPVYKLLQVNYPKATRVHLLGKALEDTDLFRELAYFADTKPSN